MDGPADDYQHPKGFLSETMISSRSWPHFLGPIQFEAVALVQGFSGTAHGSASHGVTHGQEVVFWFSVDFPQHAGNGSSLSASRIFPPPYHQH